MLKIFLLLGFLTVYPLSFVAGSETLGESDSACSDGDDCQTCVRNAARSAGKTVVVTAADDGDSSTDNAGGTSK